MSLNWCWQFEFVFLPHKFVFALCCHVVCCWLAGCDVGKRWFDLCDVSVQHINDHLSAFYDAHLLMAYLGANSSQHVDEFLESVKHYVRLVEGTPGTLSGMYDFVVIWLIWDCSSWCSVLSTDLGPVAPTPLKFKCHLNPEIITT